MKYQRSKQYDKQLIIKDIRFFSNKIGCLRYPFILKSLSSIMTILLFDFL